MKRRVSKSVWAWLAGLYEGEGTITYSRHQLSLRIRSTDRDIVKSIKKRLDIGNVNGPYYYKGQLGKKSVWSWGVQTFDEVQKIVQSIKPWLGIRRRKQIDRRIREYSDWTPTVNGNYKLVGKVKDVLTAVKAGYSYRQVATQFGVSTSTIAYHVKKGENRGRI